MRDGNHGSAQKIKTLTTIITNVETAGYGSKIQSSIGMEMQPGMGASEGKGPITNVILDHNLSVLGTKPAENKNQKLGQIQDGFISMLLIPMTPLFPPWPGSPSVSPHYTLSHGLKLMLSVNATEAKVPAGCDSIVFSCQGLLNHTV